MAVPPRPGRGTASLRGKWGHQESNGALAFLSRPPPPASSPPLCRSLIDSTRSRRTSCTWLASDALFAGLGVGAAAAVSAEAAQGGSARGHPFLLGGFQRQRGLREDGDRTEGHGLSIP